MRVMRVTIASAAVLLAANSSLAGGSDAEAFGARRWPSAPTLELDEDPLLCARSLAAATTEFLSFDSDLDIGAAITGEFEPVTMDPVLVGGASSAQSSLLRTDLDLDGDGRRQTVVYRDNEFSWKGNWHYSYVFPSPEAFETARAAVLESWQKVPQDDQYPSPKKPEHNAQQYFPSALSIDGKIVSTGNVWASHSLFTHEGRYYFPLALNDFDRYRPVAISVFRLRASGRVEPTCRISPADEAGAVSASKASPAIASFLAVIRRIGEPGPDQGTLNAATRHNAQAEAAVISAAMRPWTLSRSSSANPVATDYHVFGPRMTHFLEQWSLLGPWNRREYQTLLALMPQAEESYAAFLRTEFGMSEISAKRGARQIVEGLLARRILIPAYFEDAADPIDFFPTSRLHRAVMLRDREKFDEAVAMLQGSPDTDAKAEFSDVLADSIEWTYALDRLLSLGANPDQVNGFGKSALMTAAHFDRVDAVRRLLRAGAKVDLQTTQPTPMTEVPMSRTRRTALMYAAENAGPAVIKVLLDAGADSSLQDSHRNDLGFYLANNPRFNDEQRGRGIQAIAADADRHSRPSFDCAKARTDSELAICTSEALRAFDTQIADAFARFRQKSGDQAVRDQHAWLKRRDAACGRTEDADCLAEVLRTRLRYLHLRLFE